MCHRNQLIYSQLIFSTEIETSEFWMTQSDNFSEMLSWYWPLAFAFCDSVIIGKQCALLICQKIKRQVNYSSANSSILCCENRTILSTDNSSVERVDPYLSLL